MDTSESRNLKHKASDLAVDSNGWALMRKMGWIEGRGLGAKEQGRVEPVQPKVLKSRAGLGVSCGVKFRALNVGEVPNGANAWSEENPPKCETEDDDIVFSWSCWRAKDEAEENLERDRCPDDATILQAVRDSMLSPTCESALGPPIEHLERETNYCSEELLFEMLFYKNSLDNRSREAIASARARSNPYENVKKGIFMNRAAMKMANLDVLFNGLFSQAATPGEMLYFADICAGPGGFSEYLTWRRGHPLMVSRGGGDADGEHNQPPPMGSRSSGATSFPRIRGFGMTLRGPCDFKLNKFVAGPVETFKTYYGPGKSDGDITEWANLAGFSNLVAHHTQGQGVHVVMADGGFDVSDGFNLQEVKSKHIYLCQCLCALSILRPGGVFVAKLFDTFTDFTVELIYLMSLVFKRVHLVKPVSSRPANSERYMLCEGLIAPRMVGCPSPTSNGTGSSCSRSSTSGSQRHFKTPGSGRTSQTKKQQQQQHHLQYSVDTDSAVAQLVKHFLTVSEELHSRSRASHRSIGPSGDSADSVDVLRLAQIPASAHGQDFVRFVTKVNDSLTKRQCIYLSKMIVFADNAEKQEEAIQDELKEALMAKWQIPDIARQDSTAWPLWPANINATLRTFANPQSSSRCARLGELPRQCLHCCGIPQLSAEDLQRCNFSPQALLAVVIGDLHVPALDGIPNEPLLVYSGNSAREVQESRDGRYWRPMEWSENHTIPLPPATLVWALRVTLYNSMGLRVQALMILDAAFIYGTDLRTVPYVNRLCEIEALCNTLDCVDLNQVKLVAPKYFPLNDLAHFTQRLVQRNCKDMAGVAEMFEATASGLFCIPRHLVLVRHLVDEWVCQRSRTTGQIYYIDAVNGNSTYDIPPDVSLSFDKTPFFRVPWKGHGDAFDVSALARFLRLQPTVASTTGNSNCDGRRNMHLAF